MIILHCIVPSLDHMNLLFQAVFQTLCQRRAADHPSFPGRGLIITGKGYPDIATRHLTKALADVLPRSVPVMGLVDGDPHGIEILSVYKYGSRSLRHEKDKLVAGRLQWLGIWVTELEEYQVDRNRLLPVTVPDVNKCLSMLRNTAAPLPSRWRKELQYILHTRKKAEIEILSSTNRQASSVMHDGPRHSSSNRFCFDTDISPSANNASSLAAVDETVGPTGSLAATTQEFPANSVTSEPVLLQYLARKITKFVISARDDAAPMKDETF